MTLKGSIKKQSALSGSVFRSSGGGGGGTTDYEQLSNKPKINSVELSGNKSSSDLGLEAAGTCLPKAGGTMSGNLAMGSHKITGLANGTANTDAVNKKQMEDAIAALGEVLDFKGAVATQSDLPATGNTGGDVYYVRDLGAMFVWVETGAGGAYEWDEMGEHIDLSGYIENPSTKAVDQVLAYNGSAWVAKTPCPEVTNSSTGAVSLALDPEKLYHFTGAITGLTITFNSATANQNAHYHFDFLSGSTAATLTLPQTVVMPSGFAVEASKRYEVDILNNYGTVMAWATS